MMRNGFAKLATLVLLALANSHIGSAQSFVNLDFESATVSNGTPADSFISLGNGFPGWSAHFSYDNDPTATNQNFGGIYYDLLSLGGVAVSLIDTNVGSGLGPLNGKYSVALFGGRGDSGQGLFGATISETGMVPAGAGTLTIDVKQIANVTGSSFNVSLNGQTINMVASGLRPNYTVYEGNTAAFAGQIATLSINVPAPAQGTGPPIIPPPYGYIFDDIAFVLVPEPGAPALLGCGGLLWACLLRFRAHRRKRRSDPAAPA